MMDVSQALNRRKLAIIGPGAIGSCIAAALQEIGHEVLFVARTGFDRLRLDGPNQRLDFPAQFLKSVDDFAGIDLLILATKAHQTASTLPALTAAVRQGVPILIAQNGVDQFERTEALIRAALAANERATLLPKLIPAVVYCSAHRLAPGHVVREGQAKLILPADELSEVAVQIFAGSFMDVQQSLDWTSAAWGKLLMNASIGAVCVLTRRDMDVLHDAHAAKLVVSLMDEIVAVGRATGATFPDQASAQVLDAALKTSAGHMPSIAQDRLAGVATEWVARNEVVVRLASRYGIAVPLNAAITTLMRLGEPS
jgi:2-dehydropantoate 2-reductase